MSDVRNLLVELFVEELPPRALKALGEAFARGLAASLQAQGLAPADTVVTPYASPRRLAAHLSGVAARAAERALSQKLMPVAVALDASGQPTTALLKKLAALGADVALQRRVARVDEEGGAALRTDDGHVLELAGARMTDELLVGVEVIGGALDVLVGVAQQLAERLGREAGDFLFQLGALVDLLWDLLLGGRPDRRGGFWGAPVRAAGGQE